MPLIFHMYCSENLLLHKYIRSGISLCLIVIFNISKDKQMLSFEFKSIFFDLFKRHTIEHVFKMFHFQQIMRYLFSITKSLLCIQLFEHSIIVRTKEITNGRAINPFLTKITEQQEFLVHTFRVHIF